MISAGLQPRREGFTLRELREHCELSLRDVENTIGISRATLSRAERGIEVPSPDLLTRLSRLYGVDASDWTLVLEWRALVEHPRRNHGIANRAQAADAV